MEPFRKRVIELLKANDEEQDELPYLSAADVVDELLQLIDTYTATIRSTEIVVRNDDDAGETDYLGYFTEDVSHVDAEHYYIIDRGEKQAGYHSEARYYVSSFNYVDEAPADRESYALQDYERLEKFVAGAWWFIGVQVSAVVDVPGEGSRTVTSPGVWGIESDCGEEYVREVAEDEIAQLREELEGMGVVDFSLFADVSSLLITERY